MSVPTAALFRTLPNPLFHLFDRLLGNPVRFWLGNVFILPGEDGQE
jgi:hypothetical protein